MHESHRRRMPAQRLTESGDPIDGGAAARSDASRGPGFPGAGTATAEPDPALPLQQATDRTGDAGGLRGEPRSESPQQAWRNMRDAGPEQAWRDAMRGPRQRAGDEAVNVGQGERVASGAAGVALMGLALRRPSLLTGLLAVGGAALVHRGVTGHCNVYQQLGRSTAEPQQGAANEIEPIRATVTINRPADEVHRLWSDPATLKQMLGGLVDVASAGDGRLAWSLRAPFGQRLQWHTRIVANQPGERYEIAPEGDGLVQGGLALELKPAPGNRGTVASLAVRMQPPGGAVGAKVLELAKIVPQGVALTMLKRLKSFAEIGEAISTTGQPSGRRATEDDATSCTIGRQLGMLSLGLGAAGTLTPAAFASVMGMPQHAGLFFLVGLREMATGIGLLVAEKRAPWVWARVAGDMMDLAVLRTGLHSVRSHRGRVATALLVIGGITAADLAAARRLQRKDA